MTAKKVTHRFKCLVDQTTKLVVWMAYDASELVPPIVEPSLNYIKINFQFDAGFDIYRNYEKYCLFYSDSPGQPMRIGSDIDRNSAEFLKIQLLRTKLVAIASLGHYIKSTYERMNYFDLKIIDAYRRCYSDPNSNWVKFTSEQNKISIQSAQKLMDFKVKEYDSAVFELETIRIVSTESILHAQNITDVDNEFKLTMSRLLRRTTASLLTRTEITS